jgi:hypothetical protein
MSSHDDGVARNDDTVAPNDDAVARNDDTIARSDDTVVASNEHAFAQHDGGIARVSGRPQRRDSATIRLAIRSLSRGPGGAAAAAEAGGHRFLERIETGALAEGLGQRIALERRSQDVAAQRHFAVVGLA